MKAILIKDDGTQEEFESFIGVFFSKAHRYQVIEGADIFKVSYAALTFTDMANRGISEANSVPSELKK